MDRMFASPGLSKKSALRFAREYTVSLVAVFPQELALAKPVAHDELAMEQFFNRLLEPRTTPPPLRLLP